MTERFPLRHTHAIPTLAIALLAGASLTPQPMAQTPETGPAPAAPASQPVGTALGPADGHKLRRGVAAATRVLVGQPDGVEEFGERFLFHRVRVLHNLKGGPLADQVIRIVQIRGITTHVTPGRSGPRLYCLREVGNEVGRLGLPADRGPYFRLNGHNGSHPRLSPAATGDTPGNDPVVALVQALVRSEAGASPEDTRDRLLDLALGPDPVTRFEATMALAEREALHRRIDAVRMSRLLTRCAAETEDLTYRIALAELCATRKDPAVVEALCMGLDRIGDLGYARAAGRIAGYVAGEQAVEILGPRIRHVRSDQERGRLLVMLGASGSEAGLAMLLEAERGRPDTPMLREALLANGRTRAVQAAKRLRARQRDGAEGAGKATSRPQEKGQQDRGQRKDEQADNAGRR